MDILGIGYFTNSGGLCSNLTYHLSSLNGMPRWSCGLRVLDDYITTLTRSLFISSTWCICASLHRQPGLEHLSSARPPSTNQTMLPNLGFFAYVLSMWLSKRVLGMNSPRKPPGYVLWFSLRTHINDGDRKTAKDIDQRSFLPKEKTAFAQPRSPLRPPCAG